MKEKGFEIIIYSTKEMALDWAGLGRRGSLGSLGLLLPLSISFFS